MSAPRTRRRWMRAYGFGLLFEIGLVGLLLVLPKETWLYVAIHNLCLYSHYPLLALGTFGLLLIPLVMPWLWVVSGRAVRRAAMSLGMSRRQGILLAGALGCIAFVAVIVTVVDGFNDTPRPFQPSPEVKTVVESKTLFALDLYRTLKEQPGNLFVSPYGISTALGMVLAGAHRQTEQEIAAALHLSLAQSDFHHNGGVLRQRLSELQRRGRIRLTVANSIWCQKGDPFTDSFLALMRGPYQATAERVDFRNDTESASRRINQWIQRNTGNLFKDVITPDQFDHQTSIVLCNAIYFKGRWASQFKRGATKPAPFYVTKEQSVTVPMMHQKADFKMAYVVEDDFTLRLLELPYYGQDLSMVVILPEAVDGLGELERRLESDRLRAWLAELDHSPARETLVWLPRFKTSKTLDLVPLLRVLGVTTAFDPLNADLSGIDGINNLYLSSARQQAFVEVDEEGTKAAAVTLFKGKSKSASNQLNANHPFLFFIRENSTGIILFLGRVVDPTR